MGEQYFGENLDAFCDLGSDSIEPRTESKLHRILTYT